MTEEKPKHSREVAQRFISCASQGLVKGLGIQEPGKMCVEAAICFAFGLPHSDNPPCVGTSVREYKIKLNDCSWSSNKARAKGLLKLGIAQLGSDTINQNSFEKEFNFLSTKSVLPFLIQKHYEKEKDENLLEWIKKFQTSSSTEEQNVLWKEFYNNYNNYCYYNHNNYPYYYYYYYNLGDEFLFLVAETMLQALINLKSPGCQYLDLISEDF